MGFNLGRSMQQAEQITNYVDMLRQRNAAAQNPAGAHLQDFLKLQEQLGDVDISQRPDLLRSFLGSKGMKQEDIEGAISMYSGLRGRVVNKRMNEFRKNLANSMNNFRREDAEFQNLMMIMKAGKADEGMLKTMNDYQKMTRQRRWKEMINDLSVGYEDLKDLPEYHELLQRVNTEALMGEGAGGGSPLGEALSGPQPFSPQPGVTPQQGSPPQQQQRPTQRPMQRPQQQVP